MSAWHGSCWYGGWSPEGLNHFNKLVKVVIQDRENNTHFQAQYEIWLNKSKSKKERGTKTASGKSISRPNIIGSLEMNGNI